MIAIEEAREALEMLLGQVELPSGEVMCAGETINALIADLDLARKTALRLAKDLEATGRRMPDHACRECVPLSEILIDGFQCAYHRAVKP